ncbi:hypothetical protein [Arenimonas sp.]|uniref:hypothetical protein n=1 Tax=Arenimonas sp. TaxID=1872635 RepID=UPI0039E50808
MKTGLARLILQHLAEHGPTTTVGLVAALRFSPRQVATSVGTLQTDSKIQVKGLRKEFCEGKRSGMRDCHLYAITLLGREALQRGQPKPTAACQVVIRPAKPPALPAGHAETVDEYLARGGTVQQLPTSWQAPTKYPRMWGVS